MKSCLSYELVTVGSLLLQVLFPQPVTCSPLRNDARICFGFPCDVWEKNLHNVNQIRCLLGEPCSKGPSQKTNRHITVEHDVLLTPDQSNEILRELKFRRRKRKIQTFNQLSDKWQLPIHFQFRSDMQKDYVQIVKEAITLWESQTCIRFQQVEPDEQVSHPVLQFEEGIVCGSYIGQIPLKLQPIILSSQCVEKGSILHEMGHAIGFWHEHQRGDRDDYVTLKSQNTRSGESMLNSLKLKGMTQDLVPYDYGSMMHYWAWAFSSNGGQTIEPSDYLYLQTMGQKSGISFLDAKLANMIYCKDTCSSTPPITCEQGGYPDPNNCSVCACPDGYAGVTCADLQPSSTDECGGEFHIKTGDHLQFASPGYEDKQSYQVNTECNYLFKSSPGTRIIFEFDGSPFGVYCHKGLPVCYHWLEVKYTDDKSTTGPRFCCYGTPKLKIRADNNEMVVLFRSAYSATERERKGYFFKISTEIDCGQESGRVTEENSQCPDPAAHAQHTRQLAQPSLPVSFTLCEQMDLIVLLDISWSSDNEFSTVINFLQVFFQKLTIEEEKVLVSIVSFSTYVSKMFKFSALKDKDSISEALLTISRVKGKTNTGSALKETFDHLLDSNSGNRPNVPDACLVLVNSVTSSDSKSTQTYGNLLRNNGVTIFAVGLQWASQTELESLTEESNHVFFEHNPGELLSHGVAENLYQIICEAGVHNNGQGVFIDEKKSALKWSCDFEDQGHLAWCSMEQSQVDDSDWMLTSKPSSLTQTGPTGAAHGKNYVLFQVAKLGFEKIAELRTPVLPYLGKVCLKCDVHMFGGNVNSLSLILKHKLKEQDVLWVMRGNHGNQWLTASFNATIEAGDQVTFQAVSGHGPWGDIGLDFIRILDGYCTK